jgi:hypothetical protein
VIREAKTADVATVMSTTPVSAIAIIAGLMLMIVEGPMVA